MKPESHDTLHSDTPDSDNVQAAIAVHHLISDPSMPPEQIIERLGDITLQIQLGVQQLWETIPVPEQIDEWLTLTQIEELTFWRPHPKHAGMQLADAIRLARYFLQHGGFFNNMQGEGNWLFDGDRRPVSLGTELTRDLFFALRPILSIHQVDFDSSQLAGFRTDDESPPGSSRTPGSPSKKLKTSWHSCLKPRSSTPVPPACC